MNIDLVLENLSLFSYSADGVETLRKFVYKLATSGALSNQKTIEKKPNFKSVSGPNVIPDNWIWCELGEVAIYGGRGSIRPEHIPEDSWLLDLEDIEKVSSKLLVRIYAKDRKTTSSKAFFNEGDVLYGKLRPYLDKVLVADMSGYCTTEIVPIQPNPGLDSNWLKICLKRPDFITKVTELSYGTKMPRLGTEDAKQSIHPIPPLEEQMRIIAKVESLLSLCDQLEHANATAQKIAFKARRSAVDALSVSQNRVELQKAWERIRENWEVIAGTSEAIDSLRQLILSLAAKGKLVKSPDQVDDNSAYMELKKVCKVSWGNLSLTKSSYIENGTYLAVSAAGPDGRIGSAEHKAFTPVLSAIGARCGTMFMPSEDFTAIKNTMTFQPRDNSLDNWYLLYALMGSNLPRRGSAQPFMSKSDIENFKIRVPNLEEQRLIANRVEVLLKKCDALEAKLRESHELAEKFSRSVVSASA